jgi:iron complex transport system ATP-binding protein
VSRVLLQAEAVTLRVGGDRELVAALDLAVRPGAFVAVLGRNGTGKSLTLHTLAGLRFPSGGRVRLDGHDVDRMARRDVARRVGLLLQDLEPGWPTTVLESVLVGRHPHLAPWQWEHENDRRIALAMLARVGLGAFGARSTATLSGGEQRRVAMASLLAQQPDVYLLDEPMNHLDPHHQFAVLDVFRERAHAGQAVVATLHDPTVAARYADEVLLLHGDGRWQAGPADELLRPEPLSELYLTRVVESCVDGRRVLVPV